MENPTITVSSMPKFNFDFMSSSNMEQQQQQHPTAAAAEAAISFIVESNNPIIMKQHGTTTGQGAVAPTSVSASAAARFPYVLYQMLEDAKTYGFDDIVSWYDAADNDDHSAAKTTGFKVHNRKEFESTIMGKYFHNQTRYKSFLRQLNLYGFDRISKGPSRGCMYHPMFVKGQPSLCHHIRRPKVVSKTKTTNNNPTTTPKEGRQQDPPPHQRCSKKKTNSEKIVELHSQERNVMKSEDFQVVSQDFHHTGSNDERVVSLVAVFDAVEHSCDSSSSSSSSAASQADETSSSSTTTASTMMMTLEPIPCFETSTARLIDDDVASEIITTFC